MSQSIKIRKPDDFHLHLRDFPAAKNYLSCSEKYFARGLVMPNTTSPIDSVAKLTAYKKEIVKASSQGFIPLMSFKITPSLTKDEIVGLKKAGVLIAKLYPAGVTTNSADGVSSIASLYPIFKLLEELEIVLSIHGEAVGVSAINSEREFLAELEGIIRDFPQLKIVMEHLSTKEAVNFILDRGENIAATITVHHLLFTINDLIGSGFDPHLFCKPILQGKEDRKALADVVLSGNKKFFFGSDSAPHLKEKKECNKIAAGIFSAPVAIPLLADFFESNGALSKLENFTSSFGAEFYGLKLNEEQIELVKEPWIVPTDYFGVVPLFAGKQISWRLK